MWPVPEIHIFCLKSQFLREIPILGKTTWEGQANNCVFLPIWPMAHHNVWLIETRIKSQVWQNISTQNNLCSNSISRHSWVIFKPEQIHSMPELVGQKRQKVSLEESFMIIYKKYCGWKFALATIPVLNFEVEQFDEGGEDALFVEKDHVLLDVFQTLRVRLALKPTACNNTQQYRTLIRILTTI